MLEKCKICVKKWFNENMEAAIKQSAHNGWNDERGSSYGTFFRFNKPLDE